MGSVSQIIGEVKKVIVGKDRVLLWVLTTILARGHILLEDIPGVGKTTMALAFAKALGLENVTPTNCRVESLPMKYDFVIGRAVTAMPQFVKLTWDRVKSGSGSGSLDNGILCLKGGDLAEELAGVKQKCHLWDLSQWFDEEFFETKKVVYIKK